VAKNVLSVTKARPRKRATLRDVARVAGCSTAVVSTVVNRANGSSGAGEDLTRRIREAARDLGYRPHFASRVLLRNTAETIGIYLPPGPGANLGYAYNAELLVGIEAACQERSYDLLNINFAGGGDPRSCGRKFAEGRIDGLILLQVPHDADWVAELAEEQPNVVAINYYADPSPISTVNFHDPAALRMAVEHLAELGHRRIGYIGNDHDEGPGATLRYRGYREAMDDLGLPVRPEWSLAYEADQLSSLRGGTEPQKHQTAEALAPCGEFAAFAAERIAAMGDERPTGLVTYGDGQAVGVLLRLTELGVAVPGEVSIVGTGDSRMCEIVRPTLTSVRQPLETMGRRAAELVLDAAAGEDEPAGEITHELQAPTLTRRDSTAAPRT